MKGAGSGLTFIHFPSASAAGSDQLPRPDVEFQDLTAPVLTASRFLDSSVEFTLGVQSEINP